MATIEFKDKKAFIEIGKSDISGEFKQSKNGQYYMICDTLFSASGNDREYAIVFTKKDIVYKKPLSDDSDVSDFYVFDDGSSLLMVDDEALIRLDAAGKQITKRKIRADDSHGLLSGRFYTIGSDDEGLAVLSIYDLDSGIFIARTIPDIEYDDDEKEDQLSSDVEWELIGDRFVFVYENGVDSIAYDLDGNQVTPSQEDINRIHHTRLQKENKRKADHAKAQESLRKQATLRKDVDTISATKQQPNAPEQENKKAPVWLIIVIVVVILALIGKFVAG